MQFHSGGVCFCRNENTIASAMISDKHLDPLLTLTLGSSIGLSVSVTASINYSLLITMLKSSCQTRTFPREKTQIYRLRHINIYVIFTCKNTKNVFKLSSDMVIEIVKHFANKVLQVNFFTCKNKDLV